MSASRKIAITAGVILLVGGGVAALLYIKRDRPMNYWTPTIKQEAFDSVVGEGTTMLATPEKPSSGSLDFELIGNPLKVKITPRLASGSVLAITFSGITDYEILFPAEFADRLLKVLDEFDVLSARVREQNRRSYQQRLASIPFRDANGGQREIAVLLKSTPERIIKKDGFESEEGQVIYLRLELPFRLEDTTNFKHTEVSIPESGVRHLRELLRRITDKGGMKSKTACVESRVLELSYA